MPIIESNSVMSFNESDIFILMNKIDHDTIYDRNWVGYIFIDTVIDNN